MNPTGAKRRPLGASVADDKTTIDKLTKHRNKEWH